MDAVRAVKYIDSPFDDTSSHDSLPVVNGNGIELSIREAQSCYFSPIGSGFFIFSQDMEDDYGFAVWHPGDG